MPSAAGFRGRPGIVMTSPHTATTNPAPAESLHSRTGSVWFSGAPSSAASAENEYCVFATQTGRRPKPAASNAASWRAAFGATETALAR